MCKIEVLTVHAGLQPMMDEFGYDTLKTVDEFGDGSLKTEAMGRVLPM